MSASHAKADFVPSQVLTALALSILKFKPIGLPVREHIEGLKAYIDNCNRARPEQAFQKCLDSTAFWKGAYKESEAATSKLMNKIFDLEQKISDMQGVRAPGSNGATENKKKQARAVTSVSKQKGKTSAMNLASLASSIGASKISSKIPDLANNRRSSDDCELNGSLIGRAANLSVLSSFHQLQVLLKQPRPNPQTLVSTSVKLCENLENLCVLPVIQGSIKIQKDLASTTKQNLVSLERTYPFLVKALERLATFPAENASFRVGTVTYQIVHLWEFLIQQLHVQCVEIALDRVSEEKKSKQKKGKSKQTGEDANAAAKKDHVEDILNQLAQLLVTMMAMLEPATKRQHSELLEGQLFFFLTHLGKVLSWTTFGDSTGSQTATSSGLVIPPGLGGLENRNVNEQVFKAAIHHESKYLVWLLERIIPMAKTEVVKPMEMGSRVQGSGDKRKRQKTMMVDLLDQDARPQTSFRTTSRSLETLQNTLLAGVFGSADTTFRASLTEPRKPEPCLPSPTMTRCRRKRVEDDDEANQNSDNMSGNDWFVGQVWKLIGWNVLVSQIESDTNMRE